VNGWCVDVLCRCAITDDGSFRYVGFIVLFCGWFVVVDELVDWLID